MRDLSANTLVGNGHSARIGDTRINPPFESETINHVRDTAGASLGT